ncbi:SRPBCC domain-containing protein [Aquabacterium humicola]|uniref:SRPBCC domain-containing protein n=1 Tax=Aquabacterium humicola TaxID=3237377 RepID=UPI002543ECA2|nr:SRPBCC domain-containing protein [Rubrivivax pictus]
MNDLSARTLATSRLIDAPRERVFAAFIDPQPLGRWFGPAGFRNTFDVFEPRPGGRWRLTMHGPDGSEYPNEWVFTELAGPARFVARHVGPMHGFTLTVTLEDVGGRTRVDWHQLFDDAAECARVAPYAAPANEQNLDRLEALLAAQRIGAGPRLVEVRSYKLKPGTLAAFHATVSQQAVPMLQDWSTDVVAFGPSAHEADCYTLVRAYEDLADLQSRQDAFYGSAGWRSGPREAILGMIDRHLSSVLWLSPAAVDELRRCNSTSQR